MLVGSQITDFGACRPITNEAKQLLQNSENVLESMRNGDWKEETAESKDEHVSALAGGGRDGNINTNTGEDEANAERFVKGESGLL